jgi:hypothetical protein
MRPRNTVTKLADRHYHYTRWFKYDRDKLWLVYTNRPGHIWTTLYKVHNGIWTQNIYCLLTFQSSHTHLRESWSTQLGGIQLSN